MCATFINRNQRKIYIIVKPKSIDFENYRSFHSVKCVQALNHQLAAICLTELQTFITTDGQTNRIASLSR